MRNKTRKKSGFTITEMMLALTITALLMAALATAINASMVNVNANEGSYKAINNARQALGRICSELRTAQGVQILENFDYCTFINASGEQIQYWHHFSNGKLYLIKDAQMYTLCDGVEDMSFTKGVDPANPGNVRNVQITMTVKYGDVTKTLSTAAVVMRNMP